MNFQSCRILTVGYCFSDTRFVRQVVFTVEMDYIGLPNINTRAAAWNKFAQLCANQSSADSRSNKSVGSSFQILFSKLRYSNGIINDGEILKNPELNVLFSICDNCSKFKNEYQVDELFPVLIKYLVNSPNFSFRSVSNFKDQDLTPWTKLTNVLTLGLISLAENFPKFGELLLNAFYDYISNLDTDQLYHQFSLVGFLQALIKSPSAINEDVFKLVNSKVHIEFFDAVEDSISRISDPKDVDLIYVFSDLGFEYSSLFFVDLFEKFQMQYLKLQIHANLDNSLLSHLLDSKSISFSILEKKLDVFDIILQNQFKIEDFIENSNERVTTSSIYRRKTCLSIRAQALEIYSFNNSISKLDFEFVNAKVSTYLSDFMVSIEDGSPVALDMISSNLLLNVFGTSAILSEDNQRAGLQIVKHFPIIIQTVIMPKQFVRELSKAVRYCLHSLSKDDFISLIYTLINIIDVQSNKLGKSKPSRPSTVATGDASLIADSYIVERNDLIPQNIITAVVEISRSSNDESVITLVTTLLYQKIRSGSNELNAILLDGLTEFIDSMNKKDFSSLLKYYYDLSESSFNNLSDLKIGIDTWIRFSKAMLNSSNEELYNLYLNGLLMQIISKGDVDDLEHHRPNQSVTASANQIVIFLKPLANLLPPINEKPRIPTNKETIRRFQDAWFNLSVHGFAYNSSLYKEHLPDLLRIAHSTPALASEITWNRSETSIEMNTILRRGTSKTTERIHKDILKQVISLKSSNLDDSQLSRPGIMFLSSTLMLEMLRVQTGNCAKALEYMSDPSVIIAKLSPHIAHISQYCASKYADLLLSKNRQLSIDKVTLRLKELFIYCCHRNIDLQNCAFKCVDIILGKIPSALCYEQSSFALLDVLALLFQSIIDADTNEYEPLTQFKSRVTDINLSLSDSYVWRQETLDRFSANATRWVTNSLRICDGDMKSVLSSYVTKADASHRTVNYGVSFALDMASKVLSNDREFFQLQGMQSKRLNTTAGFLSQTPWNTDLKLFESSYSEIVKVRSNLDKKISKFIVMAKEQSRKENLSKELGKLIDEITRAIVVFSIDKIEYVKWIVDLPFLLFDSHSIQHACSNWLGIMNSKPECSTLLLSYILTNFEKTVSDGLGLYSREHDLKDPGFCTMEYLPTNKLVVAHNSKLASSSLKPHLLLIRFLSSHFHATLYRSDHTLNMFTETVIFALKSLKSASLHPFARLSRFEIVNFGCALAKHHILLETSFKYPIINALLDGSLSWFTKEVVTPFGNNKLKVKADYELLTMVAQFFSQMQFRDLEAERKRVILLLFIEDEMKIMNTWINPLNPSVVPPYLINVKLDEKVLTDCYKLDGKLAFNLVSRTEKNGTLSSSLVKTLRSLILKDPFAVSDIPSAVNYICDSDVPAIVCWTPAAPVDAINKFLPPFNRRPLALQYAMRSIESFDAHLTFFYVPQIVQTVRHDELGYIRRYILETANVSQLFAHQIIWNMSANSFKDEDSTIPDAIKPQLDSIRESMIASFSDQDRAYFEKEFSFFGEVTGISGKLKPFIKKSKPEKKAKIDEEMSKIKVEEGVYLPSNPDGVVIDIDRKSGKPLQSHAKAPFMATFVIKKKKENLIAEEVMNEEEKYEIVKTSAIFKVGDDCRQDVLALQLISMFRTIWMTAGVDVYVFPYRVTATAPGCGIIDVLPRSISRDMLGREAVNGLYEYFISQFGPETSPEFQRARINFVKSLAAYSIITYLLAIKDRHNGNIMYDQDGHILHIDFGFCFDIVPGGVKFEQSPFKLTREMVRVMGGNTSTQAYKWFEELCVKSFLACRLHMHELIGMVVPMLESGLPCFKAATIKHLTQRFVPNKSDKEAAIYIRGLIKKSFESFATKGYDEFQRITNGIPY